jgi:hypothetical protein
MREILVLFLLFFQSAYAKVDAKSKHRQELFSRYPHGLLTDDYGVLNLDDLKINACEGMPTPFSEKNPSSAYPYWQCFEVKNSKMICERGKYDPYERALMSMLVVSGTRDGELHEFISRRPIPLRSCRLYQRDWQKFTTNEKYVCVSGADPGKEIKEAKTAWVWIFGRYKTKKGCDSYFAGECHLQKVLAQQGPCEN